jgi:hypothetical protein
MLLLNRQIAKHLIETTSALLERVQRLEEEQAVLRGRLEGERQLRLLTARIALRLRPSRLLGKQSKDSLRQCGHQCRVGAPADSRARSAWRYFDGTFMPESEKIEAYRVEYERFASGGRVRAAKALRARDGTFLRA